jgi:predicted metal-dependent phosphoesterase TrpH
VAAGFVKTVQAAFDLWLAEGRPAFIERVGPSPAAVAAVVHAAGGLLSLAHPGRTRVDEEIPAMVAAGLDALEVFHSDHDAALVSRYLAMATELGLLMTGGTDFHADPASPLTVGTVTLPQHEWERLRGARDRHRPR